MLSRTVRRVLPDLRIPSSALPPLFLLPSQTRYFNATTQIVEPSSDASPLPLSSNIAAEIPSALWSGPSKTQSTERKPLSDSIKQLLPLLSAQPSHYITAHIHGRPYLVTPGDVVRLPFHMPDAAPGDVLRLNRASVIGSRDYTLKGAPYIDENIFECRATVMGTEGEPVRVVEKTKRRNRKVKTVRSKHKFTILKIAELKIKDVEDIEGTSS